MKSVDGKRHLEVETADVIYEVRFAHIQIEITGRCNMYCEHCRGSGQQRMDMPVEQIVKIIRFARQFSSVDDEVILSGGEPLMHREFQRVLENVRASEVDFITLTTNGSLLTEAHLRMLERLAFKGCFLSVSLDSTDPEVHDLFRGHKTAFKKADKALRLVTACNIPGISCSIRSTIKPSEMDEMEKLVQFARGIGCKSIGFSGIQPAGRAIHREDLWMSREQKRDFLLRIRQLNERFSDITVGTNDPLQCLFEDVGDLDISDDERIFCGCGAAATTFNVDASGMMTPCALLDIPMLNVFPLSIEEITRIYRENSIVRNMLATEFKGKCGECEKKSICGGCRARAFAHSGDYLDEDPHCWVAP